MARRYRRRTAGRSQYRNAYRTLHKLLALGIVPVINENDTVASHEIRFGDNDHMAALVAQLVHADALLLLSDVDGLNDGDPRRPGAQRIAEIRDPGDRRLVSGSGSRTRRSSIW